MNFELKNPNDFKIISAIIEMAEPITDSLMTIKTEQSEDYYHIKSLKGAKATFTKIYEKGADWVELTSPYVETSSPFDSFEEEPNESEKEATQIREKLKKEKQEVLPKVSAIETEDAQGMSEFDTKVSELINLSSAIVVIESDNENTNARDVAKNLSLLKKEIDKSRLELNRPLNDAIKSNNETAKLMTTPLDKEIERLKVFITSFETEKERLRQIELDKARKLEEEALKLEQAEAERVSRITNSIDKMKIDLAQKIESVRTSEELNDISVKLSTWTPKEEYYQEFMPKVMEVVEHLKEKINNRYDVISEFENAMQVGDTEKAEEEIKKLSEISEQEKVQNIEKESQTQTNDFQSRQKLIALFQSLGIEDVAKDVERVIEVYGSAEIALTKKDEMIQAYTLQIQANEQQEQLEKEKMKNQRVDFIFDVIDKSKLPIEFLKVDEMAIKEAIRENRHILLKDIAGFKIDGLIIQKQLSTVLR